MIRAVARVSRGISLYQGATYIGREGTPRGSVSGWRCPPTPASRQNGDLPVGVK